MADTANTSQQTQTNDEQQKKKEPSLEPHKYRYKVMTFTINTKDEAFKEQKYLIPLNPSCVKRMFILQDFDQFLQPVFQLDVVLPPAVVDYIYQHRDEIRFLLRIDEIDFISAVSNQSLGSGEDYVENGSETIVNDYFVTFTPDSMKTPNLGEYVEVSDVLAGNTDASDSGAIVKAGQNSANYTMEYTFFLWKEHDVYTLRKQVNAVYSSANIADVSSSMLSDNGFEHVLIAKPTNQQTYGQLLIPPMSMMNVFRFLQNQYGMYSTDVLFFNDIWRVYVIDKSGECLAHEDNEFTKNIISFVNTGSEHAQDSGTSKIVEKKEHHTKLDIRKLSMRSLSSINDVIQGNTNMYIDSRNNEVTTVGGAGEQRGKGCVNVTVDHEGNSYTKTRQANSIAELELNTKITDVRDYDYFAFSPNKSFILNFKDKDFYVYNGYYRLMKATHIFTREGNGDQMAIVGIFELTRKKPLSEEERKSIDYDVFRTAQTSEENKKQAEENGQENKTEDPSYKQSQDNKVAEGKMDPPKTENTGSPAPGSVTSTSNKPEGVPALTSDDKTNLDRLANNNPNAQPINTDTDPKYKAQEDKRAAKKGKEPGNVGGSKPPVPLDKRGK